ncbi:MAG: hypothetical protein SOR61_01485 [Evtepia sp.]|uniref:hypothetical protein n=1 Tax=Evtepia sp. TaxID=2773933 RepID=UPI002A75931F|nr:hypothetical protein [Evtepia sp.]MDY3013871.1 hypothetical protein [Evtepia sp.]
MALSLVLLFGPPVLVLILARKKPVPQLILWVVVAEVLGLLARFVAVPVVLGLQMGLPQEAFQSYLTTYLTMAKATMALPVGASVLFAAILLVCAAAYRTRAAK